MPQIQSRFAAVLAPNLDAGEVADIPELTPALAGKLIARIDSVRLFAHAYSLLGNFTYGTLRPRDLLVYAYEHELAGICIHLLDGEERGLGRMTDSGTAGVRRPRPPAQPCGAPGNQQHGTGRRR